jgi:hypothetical protein
MLVNRDHCAALPEASARHRPFVVLPVVLCVTSGDRCHNCGADDHHYKNDCNQNIVHGAGSQIESAAALARSRCSANGWRLAVNKKRLWQMLLCSVTLHHIH